MRMWFYFILISLLSQSLWAEVNLVVKPLIFVESGERVTFDKLIEKKGHTLATLKELKSISVLVGPKIKQTQILSTYEVARLLRKWIKKNGKIKISIPPTVVVKNRLDQFTKENVKDRLIESWKASCSDCTFEVSQIGMPLNLNEREIGHWYLNLQQKLPAGRFSVGVQVNSSSGELKNYWITGLGRVFRKVPVVSIPIESGQEISAGQFTLQNREITQLFRPIAQGNDLVGKIAKRELNVGEIVTVSDVVRKKMVSFGDIVTVKAGGDDWSITMKGQAMQDGYFGESIKVKNMKTQKLVSGVVVDNQLIEVR